MLEAESRETACLSYAPLGHCAHNGSSLSINHVLFTVAIEATFYLVSRFLLRRSVLLYHVLVWLAGVSWAVLGYHFFPSAAYFYFLGACAYHLYAFMREAGGVPARLCHLPLPAPGVYLGGLLVALLAWAFVPRPSMTMALVLAALITVLFLRTGRSALDRFVGELSFGIY